MFHPTTAIAPTVETELIVVVAKKKWSVLVAAVEPYVKICPEDTFDKQSPLTSFESGSLFAR